jgi:type III secretion protein J
MQTQMPTHALKKQVPHITRWLIYAFSLCACLLLFTGCASQRTIVNALDEREANEIQVFLSSKGINVTKVQSTEAAGPGSSKIILWDIKVNEDQATEAMSLLNQAGLPRRKGQSLLGIFAGGGLVPSELQEKIRYQAGLAEQIASTIRKIDGILDAEIQVSIPEENPLNTTGEKKEKITASVYVKHSGVLDDPNAHLVNKIRRLVAASVPGLNYDNVTVIGDRARYRTAFEGGAQAGEEKFVSIWSIILATQSVSLFRIIFFSFVTVILLLLLSLIWLAWKLLPLLNRYGGIKELFHMHPIKLDKEEVATPTIEEAKKSESDSEKEDQDDKDGVS